MHGIVAINNSTYNNETITQLLYSNNKQLTVKCVLLVEA